MAIQHYQRSISVDATPEAAYRALTSEYSHWWTAVNNEFNRIGDRVTFTFPPNVSYWTFAARKLEPNAVVELECVEAFHKIAAKPQASETEWLGSKALWEIKPQFGRTVISFKHEGLTPSLDCYEVCEAGWNMFFVDSLKKYLDTGTGNPHM